MLVAKSKKITNLSTKNRQHNGQKEKDKMTDNDPQNCLTKDGGNRTQLNTGLNSDAPKG